MHVKFFIAKPCRHENSLQNLQPKSSRVKTIWHGVRSSTKIIYTVIELTYFFVLIPFHRHKKNHEGKELIIYPG